MPSHRVLLLFPPHLRGTEPPIGIATLKASLEQYGCIVRVWDANAAFLRWMIDRAQDSSEHRFHRAYLRRHSIIPNLRDLSTYTDPGTYLPSIESLAGLMASDARRSGVYLTPGDFESPHLPDLSSDSVSNAIASHETSYFHDFIADRLVEMLAAFNPDHVGVSTIFRTQFPCALAMIGWLRAHRPDIRLIIGGTYLDALPPESIAVLRDSAVDVLMGPSESALPKHLGFPDASMAYIPPDYRDCDWEEYLTPQPVLPLTISRGCYYGRCSFCDESRREYRETRVDEVLAQSINEGFHDREPIIHFTDNAIPPGALSRLAESEVTGGWYGFVRLEKRLTDPAFIDALARGGCRMLQLGLESPVQRLLDRMRKHTDAADFPAILHNLRRSGIRSYVYLMFGLPGQTVEDCEATLTFLERHPIDFINASVFQLPAGADLARNPDAYRLDIPDPVQPGSRQIRFEAREGMNRRDLRRWMGTVFARHPVAARLIHQTPRFFKSSHAVFM